LRLCAPVASSRETRPRHWQAESVRHKNYNSYFNSAISKNVANFKFCFDNKILSLVFYLILFGYGADTFVTAKGHFSTFLIYISLSIYLYYGLWVCSNPNNIMSVYMPIIKLTQRRKGAKNLRTFYYGYATGHDITHLFGLLQSY
jgi:hypothetical protein